MNKRLRRQVNRHLANKHRESTRAEFDRFVYHEAKRRGVSQAQLDRIDPSKVCSAARCALTNCDPARDHLGREHDRGGQ